MFRLNVLIVTAAFAASSAGAQQGATPATTRAPLPIDAHPKLADYPVIGKLDGTRLHPGTWEYITTISAGSDKVEGGTRAVKLAVAGSGTGRQWLLLDTQKDAMILSVDSLFLTYVDLLAVRRRVDAGKLEITNVTRPDSIVGAVTMGSSRRLISLPNRPGMNLSATQFEAMIRTLPLKIGYRGRTELAAIMPQGNVIFPILLEVFGEAQVTVPAGTFDTWQLRVRTPSGDQRLWVAKKGGFVVKSMAPSMRRLGWVSTTVLVKKS